MATFLRSEHLKLKRTFSLKMLILVPIANVMFSMIMNPMYFVSNTINWWSILFLPLTIALWCALSNQKEQRASDYQGVYLLPVSLKKIWFAKQMIIAVYSLIAMLVYLVIMAVVGMLFTGEIIIGARTVLAVLVLWITTLWEIPLCLWLARKWGTVSAIGINFVGALGLGVILASRSLWWACPWSWSIRLMAPIVGVHPNGTLLSPGDPLWTMRVLPLGIGMSLLLTLLLGVLSLYRVGPQTSGRLARGV